MKPKIHLILGTLLLVAFYLIFPKTSLVNLTILWFSTWFLIDSDSPMIYFIKNKTINPRKFIEYYNKRKKVWKSLTLEEKKEFKYPIRIFHNLEFLLLLTLISIKVSFIFYLLIGFFFHLVLDWVYKFSKRENILKKVSLIYVLIKNKNKTKLKV
jgi:hypothetical protein